MAPPAGGKMVDQTPMARRVPPAVMGAVVALALMAVLTAGLSGSRTAQAQVAVALIGVDVHPLQSTASSPSSVENCLEVAVGDRFDVDIFARDLKKLVAWELRFGFDHRVVQIVDHNYDMFLMSTAPAGSIFPSLFDQETSDRYFLAAAEVGAPDTGSGVLARITLEAVAPGRSHARVVSEPEYMAPYLTTSTGAGLFSGPVTGGEIAVGQSCSASAAVDPPAPGSGVEPGSSPSSGSDPPGSSEEGDGDESNAGSGDTEARGGQDPEDDDGPGLSGVGQPEDDGPLEAAGSSSSSSPQDSDMLWWLVGSLIGAFLIAGTGGVLVFTLRNRS